jgi:hypothetical protein
MRAASGERLDVKATRRGLPLMIPYKQGYKIDEKRVDAFVLVWDGNELEVVGHAMTATFRSSCRRGGPPDFPIDTLYLPVAELHPLPREWYA